MDISVLAWALLFNQVAVMVWMADDGCAPLLSRALCRATGPVLTRLFAVVPPISPPTIFAVMVMVRLYGLAWVATSMFGGFVWFATIAVIST